MMLLGAATLLLLLLGGGGCSASAPVGTELAPKRVMLWLGPPAWDPVNKQLNASQLAATKANLTKFKDSITVIGTVGYSIDPGSPGFWKPNHPGVEQFNAEMIKMGFKVHPLIGGLCEDNSVCMKPLCGNLTGNACQIKYFRQIWAKPQPFIDQAVARIKAGGWDGVNIDFETGSGTADDAAKFAKFLGLLADAVHKAGARVSVDTNWGPYLNPGTLSQGNTVDTFCDMQTYGLHDSDFKGDLKRDMNLTKGRYGVGVCPTCCNPCMDVELKPAREVKWHSANITDRFKFAQSMGVREVDIWMNLDLEYTCEDTTSPTKCWWGQLADWLKAP